MGNEILVGESRSGKSNGACIIAAEQVLSDPNTVVVCLDPQPNATAKKLSDAFKQLGLKYNYEDADSNYVMLCDFLTKPSGNLRLDELNIESLLDAMSSYRGEANAYGRHLTMEYARPMCRVKMHSGLPWHELNRDGWNSDTNAEVSNRCDDEESKFFLGNLPTRRSSMNREVAPAKRFLEVLSGSSIRLRDAGGDQFIESLKAGYS